MPIINDIVSRIIACDDPDVACLIVADCIQIGRRAAAASILQPPIEPKPSDAFDQALRDAALDEGEGGC